MTCSLCWLLYCAFTMCDLETQTLICLLCRRNESILLCSKDQDIVVVVPERIKQKLYQ